MGRHKDGKVDVYEIKTRPKEALVKKAAMQLARARKHFDVAKTFIFYSDSGDIVAVQ
ncbi:hypothetical protein HN832_04395 [archaeon]|jgi:hypothetical protein|nr:hypothetical protein [archaeon]MBT4373367.1 hypothetical protein [archaeon]MBT4531815.1 hypothetical protein [archaeon]MBT7001482.1 hypothetical protein [archaeon]MBT7282626.1 hypothetical protein [archaeon]